MYRLRCASNLPGLTTASIEHDNDDEAREAMPTYFMIRSSARIVSSILAGHLLLRREASTQCGRQLVSISVRAKQCIQLASRVHQVE